MSMFKSFENSIEIKNFFINVKNFCYKVGSLNFLYLLLTEDNCYWFLLF